MRFMYAYPETQGTDRDMLDAGPIADVARTAEAAGFGGFAFTEHPSPGARWLASGGHQSLDPFVALSYVAAVTSSMKLLTYLSVLPYRNPLLLAKTAATVDKLSDGRFVLGAGTGYLKGEFRALGVDIDERNELFDEALDVLPTALERRTVQLQGTALRSQSSASGGPSRCSNRSRSGSAATPRSRGDVWPSAPRDGCHCSCQPRLRRPLVHRWSADSTKWRR